MNIESMKTSAQKGFTLIELMIVIAIIGILASIAIPEFSAFRTKAFNSAAMSDTKNGVTVVEGSFASNYKYPTTTAQVSTTAITLGSDKWNPSTGVTIGTAVAAGTTYILCAQHASGNLVYKNTELLSTAATSAAGTKVITKCP